MGLFDDSDDDSIIELPLMMRINGQMKSPNDSTDPMADSPEPTTSRPPIDINDISNHTLTLDSDEDIDDNQAIAANDISNDSIEVIFSSPTDQNRDMIDANPMNAFEANISFASIGSTDWTPIKTKFINRKTPSVKKSVQKMTKISVKKSINILNKNDNKVIPMRRTKPSKEEIAIQKERQKAQKEVLISRSQKNSTKYCFAVINNDLYELVKQHLDDLFAQKECNFRVTDTSCVDMSVTWIRKRLELVETPSSAGGLSSQASVADTEVLESHILVVMTANEFIEKVDSYTRKSGETLYEFVKEVANKSIAKNVILLVTKLDDYFRRQKNKSHKQFRDRLNQLNSDQSSQQSRQRQPRSSLPSVTREDMDLALIDMEVQLLSLNSELRTSLIKANDYSEVATIIYRYTRAVAESLSRKEKKNSDFCWFAEADNKSTVDPSDQSSHVKLFKQQLMQFPKVSYDIANAIATQYPSPQSLLYAYSSEPNPESLLSDIVVVRRQPNGTTTERKVGPELSARVHRFMTCRDGDQLLNNG